MHVNVITNSSFWRNIFKKKLLFYILPLTRTLLQPNHYLGPPRVTRTTSLVICSTFLATCSTRPSVRGIRLSTRLVNHSASLSTRNICMSTRSNTCGSIYN